MTNHNNVAITPTKNFPELRFFQFDDNWEKKKLGEIAKISAGATPNTLKKEYWNGNIRWMNSGELNLKRVYEVENRISTIGLSKSSTKILPKFCVLIGLAGQGRTRGTVAMNMVELCTNQSIASIFPNDNLFNSDFLYHNLDNRYIELRGLSTGDGGRGGLNLQIIKKIIVNFPSIPEQKRIASFFTVLDKKISEMKQKKNLLELYKKGVMQKLFSQELRFKDENGKDFPNWDIKKLGSVLMKNSNKNKGQNYSLVQSVSNKHGFINQDEMFEDRRIASKDTSNYYVIKKGHFAYNPSRIDVGSLAYKFDDEISIISPLYISFSAINEMIKDEYLLNWFVTEQFVKQMNRSFEGSVRNTLSYDSLRKITITIPCIKEQTKISQILAAIQDKINLTESQILQTGQFKKGLIQKMLI